jgi:hypothetical protein
MPHILLWIFDTIDSAGSYWNRRTKNYFLVDKKNSDNQFLLTNNFSNAFTFSHVFSYIPIELIIDDYYQ